MVGSAPSAPAAPDPVATAQAQGAMNAETARTQAQLNRVNQYGPDGSIQYSQDPGGSDSWNMTTQLSPQNQQLYDLSKGAQLTYGQAANNQLNQVSNILSQPFTGQPYQGITDNSLGVTQGAVGNAQAATAQPFSDPGAAASQMALAGTSGAAARAAGSVAQPWRDPSMGASQNALMGQQYTANRIGQMAGAPINTDYNAIRQQSIDAANSRLQPQFREQEEALRSRLLNSGIPEGSEQWNRAYRNMTQAQNDANQQTLLNAENYAGQAIQQTGQLRGIPLNELSQASSAYGNLGTQAGMAQQQAITSRGVPLNEASQLAGLYGQQQGQASQALSQAAQARQIPLNEAQQLAALAGQQGNQSSQALQQALALRTQPLNEAQALLTGQAVQSPMLQQTPQTQVAPTDYLGAVNANYAGQMNAYNQQQQQRSAGLGGAAGLLGTLGTAAIKYGPQLYALSDERAKTDIKQVGETDDGLPVYTYRYKMGGPIQMGVMAQDVAKAKPDAVRDFGGMLAVDYSKVS